MNVTFLLKQYFHGAEDVSIDVFDKQTMREVYHQVCSTIENYHIKGENLYQATCLCLYDILYNSIRQSADHPAVVLTHFDKEKTILRILVADDGIGIRKSIAKYLLRYIPEEKEALKICLETNWIGVYTTSCILKGIGIDLTIHSDNYKLISKNGCTEIIETDFWQGTIVYIEIETSRNLPSDFLCDLTDAIKWSTDEDGWDSSQEDNEPVIFKFSSYGTDFTTRDMGEIFREWIYPIIENEEDVVLDFTGVSVSDSFINECIFKLLSDKTLPKKEQPVVIKGLSETIDLSCLATLQRRCKIIP